LRKQIPVAAGLGGASSDAAAVLIALRNVLPGTLDDCTLHALASRLGSDVPFFLQAGLAKASGRGEQLRRLPYQRVDVVIVQPAISIPAKTATMYGSLEPGDWTDGSAVDNLAVSVENDVAVEPGLQLPNAFARPLYGMYPQLIELAARIGQIAESPALLSGAGPAHFVLCRDVEHRLWVRNRLRMNLPLAGLRVIAARSVKSPLQRAI
jgi:4-diphosphocytidyl-2-C-methyl-D-erythritol kinase